MQVHVPLVKGLALLHYYQAQEWHFRLLERNSMCYSPSPSLVHWSMCTVYHWTTNLPGKERGNYTHNFICKSTKRDVSDKVLSLRNFVLIWYPTDTGANKWYRSYFPLNLVPSFSHKPRVYIPTFCALVRKLSGLTWGVQAWLWLYNVHLCAHTEKSRLQLVQSNLTQRQYMYTCIRV